MQAFEDSLTALLKKLPSPLTKSAVDQLVEETLADAHPNASSENWKTHWEYVLRAEVFQIATKEGQALKDPSTAYYDELNVLLDVVLSFTEHDACEQIFPFSILYDLMETQTITSCSHIFSWIEARADRLTEGMVPQKGKALVLLRTLNDLLRRLSKMGSTTLFCGRILTFLSQVFPLGERSGVNLRGEYGPVWERPGIRKEERGEDIEMEAGEQKPRSAPEDTMQVDEITEQKAKETSAADEKQSKKDDFYQTFWSLQLPFSKPTVFAEQTTFASFKESVDKVLPVIKEATAKERALMGSKVNSSSGGLKRKRESEINIDPQGQEYFFAKYLTSPDLLDLEIADTHFRRQFLFQLLILLNHLLTFTKAAKMTWSTPRNRSLQIDFTLDTDEAQWVQETIQRLGEELRQTTPNGRVFAETVHVILEREKNWVRWKNELCAPFDKAPWAEEVEVEEADGSKVKRRIGLEEATRLVRRRMRQDPSPWPHDLGSPSLTEIWAMGYRDLHDLQRPFQPGEIQDYVKKTKQEDARIDLRKKQLAKTVERMTHARAKAAALAGPATSAAPSPVPTPAESAPATIPRPAPTLAPAATPPLHPSLPAKPGTMARPASATTPAPVAAQQEAPTQPTIVAPTPTPAAATAPPVLTEPVLPADNMITQYEESKRRWTWLALRVARDQYLQLLSKVGSGDVAQLAQEIENEKLEKEKAAKEAAAAPAKDDRAASPVPVSVSGGSLVSVEETKIEGESEAATPNVENKDVSLDEVRMET